MPMTSRLGHGPAARALRVAHLLNMSLLGAVPAGAARRGLPAALSREAMTPCPAECAPSKAAMLALRAPSRALLTLHWRWAATVDASLRCRGSVHGSGPVPAVLWCWSASQLQATCSRGLDDEGAIGAHPDIGHGDCTAAA